MRGDRAKALGIETLADLAAYAPRLKIGGDFEFFSRPEWNAVVKAYGLHFALQRQYQANFMYRALVDGDVDVISAFSSDGRIAQYDLKLLADPKQALPPYDAVLLVSPRHAQDDKFLAALKPLLGSHRSCDDAAGQSHGRPPRRQEDARGSGVMAGAAFEALGSLPSTELRYRRFAFFRFVSGQGTSRRLRLRKKESKT